MKNDVTVMETDIDISWSLLTTDNTALEEFNKSNIVFTLRILL